MMEIGHPLNIGTLAVWLSVSGFGTVGLLVPLPEPTFPTPKQEVEVRFSNEDITLGADSSPAPENLAAEPAPVAVPQPPELPQLAEIEPLPPIPSLPAAAPVANPRPSATAPAAGGTSPPRASAGTARGGSTSASRGGSSSGNGSSGLSNSARVAAGRMPSPTYPPYSRRNQQQGTVIVEFTVDQSGRVISAYAKNPSPWPLLNSEAVSTVRLWRFPPGGVMTLQRPIVFRLH